MKPSDHSFDDILALHKSHMNQSTLPGVFGDGFLNSKSKIFKNVRSRALKTGVQFAPANEGWVFHYTYYPLAFLGKIYELRTIPCVESFKAISYMRETLKQRILPNRRNQNSILHETCHVLANDFFGGGVPDFAKAENPEEKLHLVSKVLAVEAFANTTEFLVANEISEAEYSLFMEYNTFMSFSTYTYSVLKYLFEKFGTKPVFSFVFCSWYYSNYQFSQVTESEETCDLLLKNSGISANCHARDLFYSILKACFTLNRAFTNYTAQEYFANLNGPEKLEEAYAFNLEEVLFTERRFEDFLTKTHDLLFAGSEP